MAGADVDAWFASSDHPLKDAMLRVREIILAADLRVTESIKWKSPTFSFEGNIASFNPNTKKHVSLMFHQGASIPGEHPKLEGGGETVRYMRFADTEEVERSRAALEAIIRAWCEMKSRQ
jgi:hypothetical protein